MNAPIPFPARRVGPDPLAFSSLTASLTVRTSNGEVKLIVRCVGVRAWETFVDGGLLSDGRESARFETFDGAMLCATFEAQAAAREHQEPASPETDAHALVGGASRADPTPAAFEVALEMPKGQGWAVASGYRVGAYALLKNGRNVGVLETESPSGSTKDGWNARWTDRGRTITSRSSNFRVALNALLACRD